MAKPKRPAKNNAMIVVGIGASAGGLAAYRAFFEKMPPESGMAFVVVQHLDPVHKSEIAELLGRCTEMPVVAASNAMAVEADHVYVIPPNKALSIGHGRLWLSVPAEATLVVPVPDMVPPVQLSALVTVRLPPPARTL